MTPDWEEFDLDDRLIAVLRDAELNKPAKVQQQSIPAALDGRDLLISAPTGTGKTLAFLLPALQHLLDFPRQQPGPARILVLAPTRELAEQIHEQAKQFEAKTGLTSVVVTGGINYGSQLSVLEKTHDILVATPGRLMDLLEAEQYNLEGIEWLIIDEADRMLDMGFAATVKEMALQARHRQQSLLLSATLNSSGVIKFSRELLTEPEYIDVQPPKRERGKILQWVHLADTDEHKRKLLMSVLQAHPGRQFVFVRTRERVELIANFLRSQFGTGRKIVTLRGDMPQSDRQRIMNELKQTTEITLVATDIAARGLDVDDITLVVNYDLPKQADVYLHRIGRTARGGQKGTAVSLVEAHDALLLGRVERYLDAKLDRRTIEGLKPQYKFPSTEKSRSKKKVKKKTDKKKKSR
ncbi:ATP-dependent RNA helicase SrmB [Idiomarina loihiensis]|uniref:ATP-dependent RNA helicase SrmB n=1 Tax=Idiomarina loihiensis (strain ATCC BAA-735 / DSM 15497 / L2-TR) TaxID=283942 RepID=Q5QVE4_IDILO|nr:MULTISPECIES: ATP-dependent RNA helicase SrmB [Idiomarina]PHQ90496.1 MAG: ATP-dependent RNA helicase SrmB [Idiomarina sp.]AAV82963.1 ATP-dependent RNA helicase [Idiomarina loihiensis L2TR]AGM37008.1 ATP-dependent RNA helicase SrmB [Idiomarina loihiensis GSL 199]MRJ44899.1 ATP-dependent RNA helicase SrmB [Idiomarina loihiensis]PWW34895.1 ATP-dependent RNA helicase SrmB [Idiomarina loihiensis]